MEDASCETKGSQEHEDDEDGNQHDEGSSEEESEDDNDDDDSESSEDSIDEEEFSSLLWPTRDGVKHPDPQQQMQNLMQDMLAMRQENADLLVQAASKRKASEL